ncbi:uncharacterized protein PG986_005763 [Apiospora aurea]|uniref:Uncharacterized protein n=1 Tax=Apiospora aurea TaxID=335848 RepID=A0ABR1QII1_9PEZI
MSPASTTGALLALGAFQGIAWGGFALCTILILCRMGIRISCFGRPFVEDYFMLAALFLLLASTVLAQLFLRYVYQIEDVSNGVLPSPSFPDESAKGLRGFLAMMYLNYVGTWLVKLNFLLFFRRFGNHVPKYRISWWAVLLFNMGVGAAGIALVDLKCTLKPIDEMLATCGGKEFITRISITTKVFSILDAAGDALNVPTAEGDVEQTNITWFWFWFGIEFVVAYTVGCLVSFRSLFTQRNNSGREIEGQRMRREAAHQPVSKSPRGLGARARQLRQDLLTTFNEWEDTGRVSGGGHFLNSYCPPSGRLSVDFEQGNAWKQPSTSSSRNSGSLETSDSRWPPY